MTRRDLPPELEAALAARPDAAELRDVWHRLPGPPPPTADATARDAAWARLSARLHAPDRRPAPDDDDDDVVLRLRVEASASAPRSVARVWLARAAMTAIAVLGAGASWRIVPETLDAPAGRRPFETTLADGTQLVLSPGSRVRISRALGGPRWWRSAARVVRLEGQGFFAVARDGRRFEVRTADATVEVLGTRFDVRAPLGGAGTRVAVEEGRVAVAATSPASGGSGRAELLAGDAAVVEAGAPVRLAPSLSARATAWRSGGLAAIDDPLSAVLEEIARRTGLEITLDDAARRVGPVSAFYATLPAPETIVSDLATAHGLTFSRTSRGFAVTGAAPSR